MAGTSATESLRLGYFTRSVVARVARERALFEQHGLSVSTYPVRSSSAQFASLRAGEYDLVLTSPDNVAAYRLSEANPLGVRIDVRIVLGIDAGRGLSVMAGAGLTGLTDLRGRTVAVDVPSSGFALAMFDVLARAGLVRDRDFTLVSLGATPRRRAALLEGRCDATLLNAGHDIAAELAGCRRLARVTDSLSPYLGTVLAATDGWLDSHRQTAQRFVSAWLEATRIVLNPAERDFVEPLVAEEMALPPEAAAAAYAMLNGRPDGLVPDGRVDPAALRTVLRLRAEYGGPGTGIDPADLAAASAEIVDRTLLSR